VVDGMAVGATFCTDNTMKRCLYRVATLLLFAVAVPLGQAVSDTDVYLIKAEKVTFEKEKVTIVGSAKIKMVVIEDDHDPGYNGHQIWGRPAAWVHAKADKATFVIHKPKPPVIKNEKLRPKNYEEGLKNLEQAWQSTLQAARDAQAGKPVGRIGYYSPEVTIRGNVVTAIDGNAYMYINRGGSTPKAYFAPTMKIKLESVFVTDLDKALAFYTDKLGFVKKQDIPMGDTRLVTVVSPEDPNGTELMLEPNGEHPATKAFKTALYEEGIPLTAFWVEDIEAEYKRLKDLGVEFRSEPTDYGISTAAILDDTNGNLIMIYQENEPKK